MVLIWRFYGLNGTVSWSEWEGFVVLMGRFYGLNMEVLWS